MNVHDDDDLELTHVIERGMTILTCLLSTPHLVSATESSEVLGEPREKLEVTRYSPSAALETRR